MSKIEWTEITENPLRARDSETGKAGWHCEHVSHGCDHCYAEAMNRWRGTGRPYKGGEIDGRQGEPGRVEVYLDEAVLQRVLRMRKPRVIFWCSMTDWMGRFITDEMRDRMLATMALTPQHTHITLTKRAKEQREYMERLNWSRVHVNAAPVFDDAVSDDAWPAILDDFDDTPLPNLWFGVSAEDQPTWDARVPELLRVGALGWHTWVSLEPLLGPVDVAMEVDGPRLLAKLAGLIGTEIRADHPAPQTRERLGTIVLGGESGPGARPMHPDWARNVRDQCAAAGVPFFFKQWGAWAPVAWPYLENNKRAGLMDIVVGDYGAHKNVKGECVGGQWMARIGKKAAGRLLDGRTHDDLGWRT